MGRVAAERLVERMYKHKLKVTGRLPSAVDTRQMEKRAVEIAEKVQRKTKKR